MGRILHSIPTQGFEKVRDRIGEILADELSYQVLNYYQTDLDVDVWVERTHPFGIDELNAINVSLGTGAYGNKNQGSVDGTYKYFVDIYAHAASTAVFRGDKLANILLHKIAGACRAILEDPIYKTLLFDPPFISRVNYDTVEVADNLIRNRMGLDSKNVQMMRMVYSVTLNESTALLNPNYLTSAVTQMRLGISNKGYKFETGEVGPNPEPDQRYVQIVDKDTREVLYLLTPPAIYEVEQLREILDSIDGNQITIIDPIE